MYPYNTDNKLRLPVLMHLTFFGWYSSQRSLVLVFLFFSICVILLLTITWRFGVGAHLDKALKILWSVQHLTYGSLLLYLCDSSFFATFCSTVFCISGEETSYITVSYILTVSLSLFADDVKIYTRYSLNDAHGDLQIAIYRLIEWANKWQLQISIPKCSAFRIANPQWNVADDVVNLTYTIDHSVLPFTHHIRDLGIYHDSRLKYDEYISYVVHRAFVRLIILILIFTGPRCIETSFLYLCQALARVFFPGLVSSP